MNDNPLALTDDGWSPHFQSQLDLADLETTTPARVLAVHRGATIPAIDTDGQAVPDHDVWR